MNIFEAINNVMDEIGAIGKNSPNKQQGFMYRGIDAVMNALNPALIKFKVFVVPEVLEQTREERVNSKGTILLYSICKVRYTFYAEDGSSISAVVIGEGMDSGDKATNKAMSVAFKYACFQVFCIPTEEMVDPDGETHEVEPKAKAKEKPKATKHDEAVEEAKLRAKVLGYITRHEFKKADIDALCKRYKVNDLNEMNAECCKHYIEFVESHGGKIDE